MTELIAELQRRLATWRRMQAALAVTDHDAQTDAAARVATFEECIEEARWRRALGAKGQP